MEVIAPSGLYNLPWFSGDARLDAPAKKYIAANTDNKYLLLALRQKKERAYFFINVALKSTYEKI